MHSAKSWPFFSLLIVAACGGAAETTDPGAPDTDAKEQAPPAASSPEASAPPPAAPAPACDGSVYVANPTEWKPAGNNPKAYEMSADPLLSYCNKPGAHVRSLSTATDEKFGTFMDVIPAAPYRGKRVRMRATAKTASVTGWSGLWLRIDDANRKVIDMDNMQDRALRGTLDWAPQAIVLDVPTDAAELAFGVLLSGDGEVWTKELVIEVVGTDVPTTGR